jgi:hypothetical protein
MTMTDETKALELGEPQPLTKTRKTRRPLSLTDKLLELRDQKRRALAERLGRLERLDAQRAELVAQCHGIEGELERVRLALGEARDNERVDVDPDGSRHAVQVIDGVRVRMPLKDVVVIEGEGGAPASAAVVDVDPVEGTVDIVSQHDTVAHAVEAQRDAAPKYGPGADGKFVVGPAVAVNGRAQ